MKIAPRRHRFRLRLLLVAAALIITALLFVSAQAAKLHKIASPLAAYAPYDPVMYNIPYQIAGYKLLAVKTAQNTPCIGSKGMIVVIQAYQPDIDSLLSSGGDTRLVYETLQNIPGLASFSVTLEVIGSAPWNPERFMATNARLKRILKNGCLTLGPAVLPTSTPDPFAPYAPATFGLPDIVAGYRIVTVQTSGNTPCMAANQIRLTIQAVDPSPDNPMVPRDGGDIIFEVKKLHPDIDWQLEYIMPQPVTQADRERFVASMAAWQQEGCVILGGPELTLAPSATP